MTDKRSKQFRALKLHEFMWVTDNVGVLRVVGGWMYTRQESSFNGAIVETSIFVPEPEPTVGGPR